MSLIFCLEKDNSLMNCREDRNFFLEFLIFLKLGQFWLASVFRRWLSSPEQIFYSFYCAYKIVFYSYFLGCIESFFFLLFAFEKYRPTALSKMMMGLGGIGKSFLLMKRYFLFQSGEIEGIECCFRHVGDAFFLWPLIL